MLSRGQNNVERNIVLTNEQKSILKKMESSNDNMFITGYPGVGKSELLRYFVKNTKKRVVVLAFTGKAALNVQGQTIHSFFKLNPQINFVSELDLNVADDLRNILDKIDTIILDEASMVPVNLVDIIDAICKRATGVSSISFGGKQLIFFGDLYQLEPVVPDNSVKLYLEKEYGGVMFYRAHAFENDSFFYDNSLKNYELTKVFRQKDEQFKKVLNEVRTGNVSSEALSLLNSRVTKPVQEEATVILTARNASADRINMSKLSKLNGKEFIYRATIEGNISKKHYPCEAELHLKVGAKVMMLVNDNKYGRWVNGTVGVISSLGPNKIKILIDDKEYALEKYTWDSHRYVVNSGQLSKEFIGSFTQYPLKVAWAMTIHKAQGQSYKSALIDMGVGAFAAGQTYVALSRCTSLSTLYLTRPLSVSDIIVNQEALYFMKHYKVERLEDIADE